jgi:hypothetical protein
MRKLTVLSVCLLFFAGCNKEMKQQNAELQNKINELQKQVDDLNMIESKVLSHEQGHVDSGYPPQKKNVNLPNDTLIYGLVRRFGDSTKFFFVNIDHNGKRMNLKKNSTIFFHSDPHAPLIKFKGKCYPVVIPVSTNHNHDLCK